MIKFEFKNPNWQLGAFALFALGLHWYSVEQHATEMDELRATCTAPASAPLSIPATSNP